MTPKEKNPTFFCWGRLGSDGMRALDSMLKSVTVAARQELIAGKTTNRNLRISGEKDSSGKKENEHETVDVARSL